VPTDKSTESVPLDTDHGQTVIAQQNVGAGVERGGGEFPDPHTPPTPPAPGAVAAGDATLEEVINEFEAAGFSGQLMPDRNGHIRCLTCGNRTHADELTVHGLRRLEGASDPADMAAVVALECPHCGTRGTVALKYGPGADIEDADVLQLLERRSRA
jgi:hypothetical protein